MKEHVWQLADRYVDIVDKQDKVAYLFRCGHCGQETTWWVSLVPTASESVCLPALEWKWCDSMPGEPERQ